MIALPPDRSPRYYGAIPESLADATSIGSKSRVGPPRTGTNYSKRIANTRKDDPKKNNKLFSCLYLLAVVTTIDLVYSLGFREAASQIAVAPERLRNFTFPVWEQHAFSQQGFLVSYSLEDYANKIAYSNHATAYLFMYGLYNVEMYAQVLPMRVTGALPNIISLAGTTFFVLSRIVEMRLAFGQGLLILLSIASRFWALARLFCISFHLQQVAQAKCQGCYYPGAWGPSTKQP